MARIERADRGLASELDQIEQRMFLLKINYEKYFSGIERVEPVRDRDDLRRSFADLMETPIRNATQRFRFQQLKSRFQSLELYWTRNLVMMERGTHPKMKFHAAQNDRLRKKTPDAPAPPPLSPEEKVLLERQERMEREEKAYRLVFDRYMEARQKCGQSVDLGFEGFRDAIKKQVRTIKSQYNCESVKFRIVVEDGKAKVKAVPQGAS